MRDMSAAELRCIPTSRGDPRTKSDIRPLSDRIIASNRNFATNACTGTSRLVRIESHSALPKPASHLEFLVSTSTQRPLFRSYHFKPTKVDGLPEVTEVFVDPTGLELKTAGAWIDVRFEEIAVRGRPHVLWKVLGRMGLRLGAPVVGEWTSPQVARLGLVFYTTPRLVVQLSEADPVKIARRIETVVALGGYRIRPAGRG